MHLTTQFSAHLMLLDGWRGSTQQCPYALSGLVHCGLCDRRMPGSWNHEAAHYRCVFAANYGTVKGLDHPRSVHVRESAIVPKLNEWLAGLFSPENFDMTCKQLAAAGDPDEGAAGRQEAARRKLDDGEHRLAKYRAAADADPIVVAGWMAEVKGAQLAAERELAEASSDGPLSTDEVRWLVDSLKDIPQVLADADPKLKAKAYSELGVRITYEPGNRLVVAEARLACTTGGVGGPSSALTDWRIQPWPARGRNSQGRSKAARRGNLDGSGHSSPGQWDRSRHLPALGRSSPDSL
jgi:hypothetical protein